MDKLDLRDDSEPKSKELGAGNTAGCINGVVSSGGNENVQKYAKHEGSRSLKLFGKAYRTSTNN